jgi:DNA-binding transcriptional ArsR family regulator
MSESELETAVTVTRALAHPARLRILSMLRDGELCVCQITAVLGLAPSTVSAHLRELKLGGLVTERKEGRWVHVGLADEPRVKPWIDNSLEALEGDEQAAVDAVTVEELRRLGVETLCRWGLEEARRRHRQEQVQEVRK